MRCRYAVHSVWSRLCCVSHATCNKKISSSSEIHFLLTVAAHRGPADPDQPAYKTQYGPLWINIHH